MTMDNAAQPILTLSHIVKRFGGNVAVNDVSLQVMPGEVLALLGENGAGKSTLIKVLAGVYPRDGGDIRFQGASIASAAAIKSTSRQPIAFIHQDLGLIEWMTVAENMALVMGFPRRFGLIDWRAIRRRAAQALQDVGIALDPDARVFELSRTEKSLLAIARAVAVNAELLVLDEPTASLPANDVRHLFAVINRLRAKKVGMIYVTHRLDEVIEIADRICVMRDGRYVAGGRTADYSGVGGRNAAQHQQQLAQHHFGHGSGIGEGGVEDRNTAFGRRFQINLVGADAEAAHRHQFFCGGEHLFGQMRTRSDADEVCIADGCLQRFGV